MKIPPLKIIFSVQDRREILERIDRSLAEGMVAQGKNVKELEDTFAGYCGLKNGIAVNSGGSAIEVGMRILDVRDKDIIIPANTFFATASSIILAGGRLVLADISADTFSLSLESIKKVLTKNTSGVVIVHIGGIISYEIEQIRQWCDKKGLWLFEDCAHAHGSSFNNKTAGSFGVAGAYSFFATKVITSGEGGMIVTNNDEFAQKAKVLRDYGKPEPWVSYHVALGANWRMNEIAACVGLIQLKRLNDFILWREKVANYYTQLLKDFPKVIPVLPKERSSWYKYIVLLPKGTDRDKLRSKMKEEGVSLSGGVYESPLYKQPILPGFIADNFPVTEDICSRHVCLPLYYGMSDEEAEYVVKILKESLEN